METNFEQINFDQDNENLSIHIDDKHIQIHASFGASNMVTVDTCDGRPESTIPGKPERTAVRDPLVAGGDVLDVVGCPCGGGGFVSPSLCVGQSLGGCCDNLHVSSYHALRAGISSEKPTVMNISRPRYTARSASRRAVRFRSATRAAHRSSSPQILGSVGVPIENHLNRLS